MVQQARCYYSYVLLLSWHVADELIPKLREKGYRGKYIMPLPVRKMV